MRRYLIPAIAIAIVAVLLAVLWDRPAARVKEHLQAAQGVLQLKRAVTSSEASLVKLQRVDLVVALRAEDLDRLKPILLASLNNSPSAKGKKVQFDDVRIALRDQSLSIAVAFTAPFQNAEVKAILHASAAVGATSAGLHWNLYFDGIEIDKVSAPGRLDDAAAKLLAAKILALRPVLNAALDEAVNDSPATALILPFSQSGVLNQRLADLSDDEVTFDDRPLLASLRAESTAVIIDKRGILVAADVEVLPASIVQGPLLTFPDDPGLVLQPAEQLQDRIRRYRSMLLDRVRARHKDALDALLDRKITGAAVSKETISRVFNSQFDASGMSATIRISKPTSSRSNLTFKIAERDCGAYFDACHYRDTCAGDRCERKVTSVISKTCKYSCWVSTGLLGALIPGVCDKPCDETIEVLEPVQSAQCDAFRLSDKVHGGLLCKAASNVDKAVCDIDAAGHKLACSSTQEIRRFYEKNPVATVKTTMAPDATVRAHLSSATWSSDLSTLDANIGAEGSGVVRAGISYDRHNYADALILGPGVSLGLGCATDWSESVEVATHATLAQSPVQFSMTPAVIEGDVLRLQFKQVNALTAHADFRPGPLAALFGGKPQVTLNCPLAAISAVIFGSAEAVFTQEDARKVFPLLTGQNYPIKLEEQKFKVDIKPIPVCSPADPACKTPMMLLVPTLDRTVVRFAVKPN